MKQRAYELAAQPGHHCAVQFGSPDVTRGYEPLGAEISTALSGEVDVLCASVGVVTMACDSGLEYLGGRIYS